MDSKQFECLNPECGAKVTTTETYCSVYCYHRERKIAAQKWAAKQ